MNVLLKARLPAIFAEKAEKCIIGLEEPCHKFLKSHHLIGPFQVVSQKEQRNLASYLSTGTQEEVIPVHCKFNSAKRMLHNLLTAFVKLHVLLRPLIRFFIDFTVFAPCNSAERALSARAFVPVLAFSTGSFIEKVLSFCCFLVVGI